MAKSLKQSRPRSSISDMIASEVVEQATQMVQVKADAPAQETTVPPVVPLPVVENVHPPAPTPRTGEHTDIQKMYRLTPSAYRTLQQLRLIFSGRLGFDVPNSAAMRSILYAVEQALPDIGRVAAEQVRPCTQPSTAIGNEQVRDSLEKQLAEAVVRGFLLHARHHDKR